MATLKLVVEPVVESVEEPMVEMVVEPMVMMVIEPTVVEPVIMVVESVEEPMFKPVVGETQRPKESKKIPSAARRLTWHGRLPWDRKAQRACRGARQVARRWASRGHVEGHAEGHTEGPKTDLPTRRSLELRPAIRSPAWRAEDQKEEILHAGRLPTQHHRLSGNMLGGRGAEGDQGPKSHRRQIYRPGEAWSRSSAWSTEDMLALRSLDTTNFNRFAFTWRQFCFMLTKKKNFFTVIDSFDSGSKLLIGLLLQ